MSREIIFRGKRIDNGEWAYGYVMEYLFQYKKPTKFGITVINNETHERELFDIDPTTIGQYTGLTDKNGTKVFEGDKVRWAVDDFGQEHEEVIEWRNGYWLGGGYLYDLPWSLSMLCEDGIVEVIGNIHDKEELNEIR